MRQRDFIGIDWKNGDIVPSYPTTNCIINLVDKRYEFLLTDTQIVNDTPYDKIFVTNSASLSDTEWLKRQESGLKWLLNKYLGNTVSSSASAF